MFLEVLIILFIIVLSAIFIFFCSKLSRKLDTLNNETKEIFANCFDHIKSLEKNLDIRESLLSKSISETTSTFENHQNTLFGFQSEKLKLINQSIEKNLAVNKEFLNDSMSNFDSKLRTFSLETEQKLNNIRNTIETNLDNINRNSSEKLDKMRVIVDQKLQKTLDERLSESFKHVNIRLQEVYKGLGEMQTLARGVGDLKKILSNVKTRGILGEVQLGSILEEILSSEQYEKNVATKKNSKNFVEYAVKMPADDENFVYLPIDSKFPGEIYGNLRDAYDEGDAELVKVQGKTLVDTLKFEAKSIRDKYIDVPQTTDFAIMFLPFEGLYTEAVNRGMIEILQREYHINIAGPSTMAAFLNSLQMGFRTVAIQKRSAEVWKVLSSVKTEFDKFYDALSKTKMRLSQANDALDDVLGVRMRQVQRSLKNVSIETNAAYDK